MRISWKLAAFAVAGLAGAAHADTILTFGFTDLSGSFNSGTATYAAIGVDQGAGGALRTQGDVSRTQSPTGTATYLTGQGAGRIFINMAISNIQPNTAQGVGTITILDADGDTLVANLNGNFFQSGVAVFFNGSLSNPVFTDNGVPDTTFDGPGGGSFLRSFSPATPPFDGAIVQLYMGSGGNLFSSSFSGVATQVNGAFIPAPGAGALLGLGAVAAWRRRRR
jgi:hypothetical protein